MITPDQIKDQAQRWYADFLTAAARGEAFFPKDIRFGKIKASETLKHHAELKVWLHDLTSHSKSHAGYGYSLEWIERKDQKIGVQSFPERICFEDEESYLKFIGKHHEYRQFLKIIRMIRDSLPQLEAWAADHPLRVLKFAGEWDGLIKVCLYQKRAREPRLLSRG